MFQEKIGDTINDKYTGYILTMLCGKLHKMLEPVDHIGVVMAAVYHGRWMLENDVCLPPCKMCGCVKTILKVDDDSEIDEEEEEPVPLVWTDCSKCLVNMVYIWI